MNGTQKDQVQKLVTVDRSDSEWVDEHYPNPGFWAWFVRNALRNFRALHTTTPDELILEGVKGLREVDSGEPREHITPRNENW